MAVNSKAVDVVVESYDRGITGGATMNQIEEADENGECGGNDDKGIEADEGGEHVGRNVVD